MADAPPDHVDVLIGTALETARHDTGLIMLDLALLMQTSPFHPAQSEAGRRRLRTCELVSASPTLRVPISTFYERINRAFRRTPMLRLVE